MSDHTHPHAPPTHHVHETAPLHDPVDSWHDHTRDQHPQHAHAEVGNAPLVMGVGLGLFLLIVASVLLVDSFYRGYASNRLSDMEADAAAPNGPAILTRTEKSQVLLYQQSKEARWVTIPAAGEVPARNFAQIPTAVATELALKQYAPVINADTPGGNAPKPPATP